MPKMNELLPDEFLRKMQEQLPGEEFEEFQEACLRPLRKSIRVNTLKISVSDFRKKAAEKGWLLSPIPWCSEGFWIDRPPEEQRQIPLGKTWAHALGLFYIQEASSMLPVAALQLPVKNQKPKGKSEKLIPHTSGASGVGLKALDMAAAPGSKTTQLAAEMGNAGLIVANEFSASRIKKLFANLERCGVRNSALTHMDGEKFGMALPESFDLVLLDAPCTGEGTVRKDREALNTWSERNIRIAAGVQKKLILSAFAALRQGGTLIYSTCTLNREENEEVCFFLQEKFPQAEFIPLSGLFPGAEKALTAEGFLRVWPHLYDTEGFFVAKIQKKVSPLSSSGLRQRSKSDSRFRGNDKLRRFPFSSLSLNTLRRIELYYGKHFGFAFPFAPEQLRERGREIWLFPEGIEEFIGRIKFDRIGIKLCELHEKGVKSEHETAAVFGNKFFQHVLSLPAETAQDFLEGKNLPSSGEEGELLCTFDGFPLGFAKAQGEVFKNLLPRSLVQEQVEF